MPGTGTPGEGGRGRTTATAIQRARLSAPGPRRPRTGRHGTGEHKTPKHRTPKRGAGQPGTGGPGITRRARRMIPAPDGTASGRKTIAPARDSRVRNHRGPRSRRPHSRGPRGSGPAMAATGPKRKTTTCTGRRKSTPRGQGPAHRGQATAGHGHATVNRLNARARRTSRPTAAFGVTVAPPLCLGGQPPRHSGRWPEDGRCDPATGAPRARRGPPVARRWPLMTGRRLAIRTAVRGDRPGAGRARPVAEHKTGRDQTS